MNDINQGAAPTPGQTVRKRKNLVWLYWMVMIGIVAVPLAIFAYVLVANPFALFDEQTFYRYAVTNMTEEHKKGYYAILARNLPASMWESVPEPMVGRVLQWNVEKTSKHAKIVTNSAGLRSSRPYTAKGTGTFRIVCLGDSMVMGTGIQEEHRWGDQIESILRERGVTVGGKDIEVYSLGIGSWSSVNEVTYLAHRISHYEPDVVLTMMVGNDLNDNAGVMGIGQATYRFTPEQRSLGSGVFVDDWPRNFGVPGKNLLTSGMGPESESRWENAFAAWKRLEVLVTQTGGRMLFGVLDATPLFMELSKLHFARAGLTSPFIITSYFGERLPHDPHPNKAGNGILAAHYLHVLADLGWIPVRTEDLPRLHENLTTETRYPPDTNKIDNLQSEAAISVLDHGIEFESLRKRDVLAMLGGIYPGSTENFLEAAPFGTLKSGFLLRRRPDAESVVVKIEVPPYPELYPFEMRMYLDGRHAATLSLETVAKAGRHSINGALPEDGNGGHAVEIMLRTDGYWTTIDDFTMKSYQLISVVQK